MEVFDAFFGTYYILFLSFLWFLIIYIWYWTFNKICDAHIEWLVFRRYCMKVKTQEFVDWYGREYLKDD